MALVDAINELEKLVEENSKSSSVNRNKFKSVFKDSPVSLEISLKKLKKVIDKAERCGHVLQMLTLSYGNNFYFKCDKCDKKTAIEESKHTEALNASSNNEVEIITLEEDDAPEIEQDSPKVDDKKESTTVDNGNIHDDEWEDSVEKLLDDSTDDTNNTNAVQSEKAEKENSKKKSQFWKSRVLFSGYRCKDHVKIIIKLGGKLTSNVNNCTVMVTDRLRLTSKMLLLMRRGLPVVSPAWILACKDQGGFVDPWDHILIDQYMEKVWDFNLKESLNDKPKELLKGYSVHVTRSVKPDPNLYDELIQNLGGKIADENELDKSSRNLAISCKEDAEIVKKLKDLGVKVVSKDFLISVILCHKFPSMKNFYM